MFANVLSYAVFVDNLKLFRKQQLSNCLSATPQLVKLARQHSSVIKHSSRWLDEWLMNAYQASFVVRTGITYYLTDLCCIALGCANPTGLPTGVWLQRDTDTAILRCNSSRETWRITCRGSEWRGQTRVNCSQSASSSSSAAAFPLDGIAAWDLTHFFAHEAFPLSKKRFDCHSSEQ